MSRVKRAQRRARPADTSDAAVGAFARILVDEKHAGDDPADPIPGPPFENEG